MLSKISSEMMFFFACLVDFLVVVVFAILLVLVVKQYKKINQIKKQLSEEKKWHKIAYIDALTGMRNRMAYNACSEEIQKGAKEDDVIHIIVMDINDFKRINDTQGHNIGDETLQMTAELLDEVFGEEAFFTFRMGGDEFAIIAIGVESEEIEKKISMIKNSDVGDSFGCTFSFGWSRVDLQQEKSIETAHIMADRMMYMEKAKTKRTTA